MKYLITVCFIVAVAATLINCKKSNSTGVNSATCQTCSTTPIVHTPDTSGAFYYLPTAFTPNGDGMNDVYGIYWNKLDTDSSWITIWDMSGREVYSEKITVGWTGFDHQGHACPSGRYPVYVSLRDTHGGTFTSCACVTLLKYNGSCIITGGTTYYFPDQVDLTAGFVFPTNDVLCP